MKPGIDPEFSSVIPPLSPEELEQLEKNLLEDGCRDPLVVWGDILIDGHNRFAICERHDIPYELTQRDFASRDEAMQYIILNQFGRRNLSAAQRSMLALKLEPIYRAQAERNLRQSPGRGNRGKKGVPELAHLFSGEKTRDKLARVAGVSHGTLDKVKRIAEDGDPEQLKRIEKGGHGNSISAVYAEVRKAARNNPAQERADSPPPPAAAVREDSGGAVVSEDAPASDGIPVMPPAAGKPAGESSQPSAEDLARIRGYVKELKNPELPCPMTTEMFLAEYRAFAERLVRGVSAYSKSPYLELYPQLSKKEQRQMKDLNRAIIQAVHLQETNIEGVTE